MGVKGILSTVKDILCRVSQLLSGGRKLRSRVAGRFRANAAALPA